MTADPPPPPPAPGHRWVGTLYCLNPTCGYVLAEVFADRNNDTYLPQIGAEPVRFTSVTCPRCRRIRRFETSRVLPVGVVGAPHVVGEVVK